MSTQNPVSPGAMLSILSADDWIVDPVAVSLVDGPTAKRHSILPIGFDERLRVLHLAMTRPDDSLRRSALRADIDDQYGIYWHRATDAVVQEGLLRCFGALTHEHGSAVSSQLDEDLRIVRLVDDILYQAVAAGASDIHLLPSRDGIRARVRVHGHMQDLMSVEYACADAVINRVKVMAALDIAETRRPQDGRLCRLVSGRPINMRVSTFPLLKGENLVLRLHDSDRGPGNLQSLGLDTVAVQSLIGALETEPGLVVVCGPTGSGKTTTLYAMLKALDDGSRALMTLEDPIEHELEGVAQAAVDPSRAIDFSSGIRAMLRQDPDVLMVGEIRDTQSCRMAVRAALSGLRVLGTLHAKDCCSAVARLVELGAQRDELAVTLTAVIAQRLLRRSDETGRLALVEIMRITPKLRAAIKASADTEVMADIAFADHERLDVQARRALDQGIIDANTLRRVFGDVNTQDTGRRKDAHCTISGA